MSCDLGITFSRRLRTKSVIMTRSEDRLGQLCAVTQDVLWMLAWGLRGVWDIKSWRRKRVLILSTSVNVLLLFYFRHLYIINQECQKDVLMENFTQSQLVPENDIIHSSTSTMYITFKVHDAPLNSTAERVLSTHQFWVTVILMFRWCIWLF